LSGAPNIHTNDGGDPGISTLPSRSACKRSSQPGV
jgi:hypothetical protein